MKQLNSLTNSTLCMRGWCCYKRRLYSDYGLPLVAKLACKEMIDRTSCRETQTKKVPPPYILEEVRQERARGISNLVGWLALLRQKSFHYIIECIVRWGYFPLLFAKIRWSINRNHKFIIKYKLE